MMDLMPPADASALATKADLAALRTEIRADVKEDLLQLQRTFGTWLFTSQAAIIAVVGVVTAESAVTRRRGCRRTLDAPPAALGATGC